MKGTSQLSSILLICFVQQGGAIDWITQIYFFFQVQLFGHQSASKNEFLKDQRITRGEGDEGCIKILLFIYIANLTLTPIFLF